MALGLKNSMTAHAAAVVAAMGGAVTYTPSGGAAVTINGNLQSPYAEPTNVDTPVSSNEYTLIVKTTDVTGIAQGDAFTIETVAYTVENVEPMQTGLSRVILSKD